MTNIEHVTDFAIFTERDRKLKLAKIYQEHFSGSNDVTELKKDLERAIFFLEGYQTVGDEMRGDFRYEAEQLVKKYKDKKI